LFRRIEDQGLWDDKLSIAQKFGNEEEPLKRETLCPDGSETRTPIWVWLAGSDTWPAKVNPLGFDFVAFQFLAVSPRRALGSQKR